MLLGAGDLPAAGVVERSHMHMRALITGFTWVGSDGTRGDLPNGIFETIQDMPFSGASRISRHFTISCSSGLARPAPVALRAAVSFPSPEHSVEFGFVCYYSWLRFEHGLGRSPRDG
jgi:hypothetical protein